ncbi:unnamed protein product [Periconia digitata]|uniref:Uncharacterized protein n=1 Tax=Periconia digitata TaxID=1303443 RepID=A0A9W4XMC6_9PLEO|nr:unnamed protein product [Periconia digitata]
MRVHPAYEIRRESRTEANIAQTRTPVLDEENNACDPLLLHSRDATNFRD